MLSILRHSKRFRPPKPWLQQRTLSNSGIGFREFSTGKSPKNPPSTPTTSKSGYLYGLGALGFAAGILAYFWVPNDILISLPKPPSLFSSQNGGDATRTGPLDESNAPKETSKSETADHAPTKSESLESVSGSPPSSEISSESDELPLASSPTTLVDSPGNDDYSHPESNNTGAKNETDASEPESNLEVQLKLNVEKETQAQSENFVQESDATNHIHENEGSLKEESASSNEETKEEAQIVGSKDGVQILELHPLDYEKARESPNRPSGITTQVIEKVEEGNKEEETVGDKEKEKETESQVLSNFADQSEDENKNQIKDELESEKEKEKRTSEILEALLTNPTALLRICSFFELIGKEQESRLKRKFGEILEATQESVKNDLKELDAEIVKYAQTVSVLYDTLEKELKENEKKLQQVRLEEKEKYAQKINSLEEKHLLDLEKQKKFHAIELELVEAKQKLINIQQLKDVNLRIRATEKAFLSKSELKEKNHEAHILATATFALMDAVSQGQPFVKEINFLKELAKRTSKPPNQNSDEQVRIAGSIHDHNDDTAESHGPDSTDSGAPNDTDSSVIHSPPSIENSSASDSFLECIVDSLPADIAQRGVLRDDQLKEKFESMVSDLQQLTHISLQGGGLLSHSLAKLLSFLKAEEHTTSSDAGIDSVVSRARILIASGNYVDAALTIEKGFKGTGAERIASNWSLEAQNKAIVDQALQAIQAFATSQNSVVPWGLASSFVPGPLLLKPLKFHDTGHEL